MAESMSDGEAQAAKPPPKRRRILDPSAIVPVPVYSSKVSSSLQLKPMAPVFTDKEDADDGVDDGLWSQLPSRGAMATIITLSDSEEDEAERVDGRSEHDKLEAPCCPSPPPPQSPVQKQSRQVRQKLSEINRRLQAVNSLMTPEHQDRTRSRCRKGPPSLTPGDEQDDDVIVFSPSSGCGGSPYAPPVREIPLKVRCRTDVHKIPVLSSTPLNDVLAQLSAALDIPPPRLLLLREEVELPTDSTVGELGLGIADIIECVVMAAEDKNEEGGSSFITVRLQSKDRDASQTFSLHKEAPLGSIFSQYLSRMSPGTQRRVRFHFDGAKVTDDQTPTQLDMEDGDIIEVWI